MRYSKTTNQFYPEEFSYPDIPKDVVTIPDSDFDLAMNRGPDEDFSLVGGRIVISKIAKSPAPVPTEVEMYQARLALLSIGVTSQDILAKIDLLPSPQKEQAQIMFEFSPKVKRDNGFVTQLAPALGLTDIQIDQLFVVASTL